MSLLDFMKRSYGKIFTSIILALGLASLIRLSCKSANMVVVNGPPLDQIKDKIFSFDSKCYSYKTVATSCKSLDDNKDHLDK
jgi:hypothetical protein